ncbi:MAG: hydroxymethylglutaryl-CoA lyase [Devosia sp.]
MGEHVTLYEVSPRDGLQNERRLIPTADKVRLIDMLSACGFSKIEATSFVSPKLVPQMADAAQVLASITRKAGVTYAALTPTMQGYVAARDARVDEVAVFASASEGFSRANINASIAESLVRFRAVAAAALADGVPVRGYVSCVTDCPYDGPTPPEKAAEVAAALIAMGCYEVSLGDTIGAAVPDTTRAMLDATTRAVLPCYLAGHFHDTRARALDNIEVCLDYGLRTFDASVGGLGGCPFAPSASGNVATESVVSLLHRRGFETGIDTEKLVSVATFARMLRKGS